MTSEKTDLDDIFGEFTGAEKKEETKPEPQTQEETQPEPKKEEEKPTETKQEAPVEKKEEKTQAKKEPTQTDDFFGETPEPSPEEAVEGRPTAPVKPLPTTPKTTEEFKLEEEPSQPKKVIVLYGWKGHGKTFIAFTLGGKILCLSFDHKSQPIKAEHFPDATITVRDAVKYLDKSSPEAYLESSERTFRYINWILDQEATKEFDWVIIDGSEILQVICEMTMRYRNNIMPFQGIANRNLWKERRMYISQIHNKALGISSKGVVYTTYTEKEEIIKDGETVAKEDVPKWIDVILYETDIVIRVRSEDTKGQGRRFFAEVESSKTKKIPTGRKRDVTDAGMKALLEEVNKA